MTEGVITIKDNSKAPLRNEERQAQQPNVVIGDHHDMMNKKKKPLGIFGFFKAAMFVLRHRTKGKQKAAQVAVSCTQQGDWKKLVGSMRPLHLQDNNNINTSPGYCATSISSPSALSSSSGTMSQYASANDLKALDDTMSQYASANNLQELDEEEEEEDPDQVFDAIGADDMIDAKAEQFILQFYQQMKRQNIDSMSGQFN